MQRETDNCIVDVCDLGREQTVPPISLPSRQGRTKYGEDVPKTILIVDDNAYIRQMICEALKRESDFEVCGEAENGKEAIDKALASHPDLIVLDLSMPVMNGLEAARHLRDRMPSVPIILLHFMLISLWRKKRSTLACPM